MPTRTEIEALFEGALERPPDERRAWVGEACGADEEVLADVLRLLRAHDRAEGILDQPRPLVDAFLRAAVPYELNRRLGAYRLVREIGRGGMSIVYLAERDDQEYRQSVAIKLIRRGLDTPDLVRRFLTERQILASLEHPNIARLLDGGTTEDGLPYLVMEYVRGEPVTEYCERGRLPLPARIRLLIAIARTVQYAHRNLVVHRDLKPSNILITQDGEIKLLDFGIAKLLDHSTPAAAAPQTRPGLRLMTPEYASPEQLDGGPITTATDVYGLGRVLAELLDGCEGRRGDLDAVVLTALREEPERRYPSAEQLAEDLERYLRRLPVRARGDSVAYRLERFVRRHRWGVGVAAAFALLIAGYAATITVKEREVSAALERAQLEAQRAEEVTSFLMRLFEVTDATDATAAAGGAITARELLERGAAGSSPHPASVAASLHELAWVLHLQGELAAAEPLYLDALAIYRRLFGESHPVVASTLSNLGLLKLGRGEPKAADALYREALAIRRAVSGGEHPDVATSLGLRATLKPRAGELARAEELYREAVALQRRVLGSEHPDLAHTLNRLALVLRENGDYPAADSLYAEVLGMRLRLLGEAHPAVATTLNDRGVLMRDWGNYSQAESLLLQALQLRRELLGESHPHVEQSLRHLAALYAKWDKPEQERAYRELLANR